MPKSQIIGNDGAPMALVPEGSFQMGERNGGRNTGDDERPVHTVYLDSLYIDVYLVTNHRYKQFMDAT